VQPGDTASKLEVDLVELLNGATIRRASSRPTTSADVTVPGGSKLTDNNNLVIDTQAPTITGVVADGIGATTTSYGVGSPFPGQIDVKVTFSAPVTVSGVNTDTWYPPPHLSSTPLPAWGSTAVAPTLELATGWTTDDGVVVPNRKAVYSRGSGSSELFFTYTVQELDKSADLAYPNAAALVLGGLGSTIKRTSTTPTTDAILTLPAPGAAGSLGSVQAIVINDNSVPTITSVTSAKPDGTYGAGEQIDVQVIFSKRVRISTGLNQNKAFDARAPEATTMNNKIYAAWSERVASGLFEVRVAKSVGIQLVGERVSSPAWTFVHGTSFPTGAADALQPSLAVATDPAANSKLYLAWTESTTASQRVRVAVYNGNDASPAWAMVGTGISSGTRNAHIISWGFRVVVAWQQNDAQGISQARVALYNGNDAAPAWQYIDGTGLNRNAAHYAHRPKLVVFDRGQQRTGFTAHGTKMTA
jgi:hypothetical protein